MELLASSDAPLMGIQTPKAMNELNNKAAAAFGRTRRQMFTTSVCTSSHHHHHRKGLLTVIVMQPTHTCTNYQHPGSIRHPLFIWSSNILVPRSMQM